jgi:hypothetical protein
MGAGRIGQFGETAGRRVAEGLGPSTTRKSRCPARSSCHAADSPARPEPRIMTSVSTVPDGGSSAPVAQPVPFVASGPPHFERYFLPQRIAGAVGGDEAAPVHHRSPPLQSRSNSHTSDRVFRRFTVLVDYSPIQLGTSGICDGRAFTVIGRIQLRYADGNWNEWCLAFHDRGTGWLGDASGSYIW